MLRYGVAPAGFDGSRSVCSLVGRKKPTSDA